MAWILRTPANGANKPTPTATDNISKPSKPDNKPTSTAITPIITNERNGKVIYVREATDQDEIMLTSKNGMMVRVPVEEIRIQGRNTMGVRIMRLNERDKVVSVAKIVETENDEASCEIE